MLDESFYINKDKGHHSNPCHLSAKKQPQQFKWAKSTDSCLSYLYLNLIN